jgi:biotin-dependent carboxylase-like uncharacterized protein
MVDHLAVIDPGMQSTVQDFGRYGLQRYGVSAAGAIDPLSMQIANALVGNARDEAVIELTMSGGAYRVEAPRCRVAVTGADMPLTIDGAPAEAYRAYDLERGSLLSIGFARAGMRAYLAVAGGFAIDPVLGSRSTHLRSQLGGLEGKALKAGSRLPLREATGAAGRPLMLRVENRPVFAGTVRVLLGPQADAFTKTGIDTFLASAYTVTSKTDRMGCQFDGPLIAHRDGFNIISDGIVNGSIQVPGSGMPIVLLADRQSTGGYPKIATVVSADLARVGQARIGESLRFEAIPEDEAERSAIAWNELIEKTIALIEPVGLGALSSETLMSVNLIGGVVSAQASAGDDPVR